MADSFLAFLTFLAFHKTKGCSHRFLAASPLYLLHFNTIKGGELIDPTAALGNDAALDINPQIRGDDIYDLNHL